MHITRFEYKYQIKAQDYYVLKCALAGRCRLDTFSRIGGGRYHVRSLYYDSPTFAAYHEKMDGVFFRKKLRLRSYWTNQPQTKFINAEIKIKLGDQTAKHTARILPHDWESFMGHNAYDGMSDAAEDFMRISLAENLRPNILIAYEREVWETFQHSDLRISMDFNIRSANTRSLYGDHHWESNHKGVAVLEIKTAHALPEWLNCIVKDLGLAREANSKYANGIHHSLMVTNGM